MRELKYYIIEETADEINAWRVYNYREAINEYKRLKKEHPENTYRLQIS